MSEPQNPWPQPPTPRRQFLWRWGHQQAPAEAATSCWLCHLLPWPPRSRADQRWPPHGGLPLSSLPLLSTSRHCLQAAGGFGAPCAGEPRPCPTSPCLHPVPSTSSGDQIHFSTFPQPLQPHIPDMSLTAAAARARSCRHELLPSPAQHQHSCRGAGQGPPQCPNASSRAPKRDVVPHFPAGFTRLNPGLWQLVLVAFWCRCYSKCGALMKADTGSALCFSDCATC